MNRILLVEDHAAMRELVVLELQHAGIAADAVGRISEAEACLTQVRYAALVLDRPFPRRVRGGRVFFIPTMISRFILLPCSLFI